MRVVDGILSVTVLIQAIAISKMIGRKQKIHIQSGTAKGYLFDTNVIMDGRMSALYETGLMQGSVIIHEAVLKELHILADGKDALKRERARNGLAQCESMKQLAGFHFSVVSSQETDKKTDDILVEYATKQGCLLITNDAALAELGRIHNVQVLTMHTLEQVLKPKYYPGDQIELKIVRMGDTSRQGIAYLEDGTMVVVEQCRKSDVHTVLDTIATHYVSTNTGRILFARKISR